MRVIGVDLAWGSRARTGLCVVEGQQVLDSVSLRLDAEIDAWIQACMTDEMLLAIDAPIIVENLLGRRPCERVLSRAYGAQHAAPHSSNRAMPSFRGGSRARALARRLSLEVSPDAIARHPIRVAIEVYPHPALVSLFGLNATLKYKRRAQRTPVDRHEAFRGLLGCLRSLAALDPPLVVESSPRWGHLERSVGNARSHTELDLVEDELDAYLCAYVGLYHLKWRGSRSLVVGDEAQGYIITPVDSLHQQCIRTAAAELKVPVG